MTGRPLPELPEEIRVQSSYPRSRKSFIDDDFDKHYP